MKCQTCVRDGLKSTVELRAGFSTLALPHSYHDPAGAFHSHDPNYREERYSCSEGHAWSIRTYPVCPQCGWCVSPDKRAQP